MTNGSVFPEEETAEVTLAPGVHEVTTDRKEGREGKLTALNKTTAPTPQNGRNTTHMANEDTGNLRRAKRARADQQPQNYASVAIRPALLRRSGLWSGVACRETVFTQLLGSDT